MPTSWTNSSKHSSSYTDELKSVNPDVFLLQNGFTLLLENGDALELEETLSTSYAQETKNTSQYTNEPVNSSTWENNSILYMLDEFGAFVLQENGNKIVLEQSLVHTEPDWTNILKNG